MSLCLFTRKNANAFFYLRMRVFACVRVFAHALINSFKGGGTIMRQPTAACDIPRLRRATYVCMCVCVFACGCGCVDVCMGVWMFV